MSNRFAALFFAYYSCIVVVGTYPDPDKVFLVFDSKRPIVETYPSRPELTDLFEMKGWIRGICLKALEVAFRYFLDGVGKIFETLPKPLGGSVHLEVPELAFAFLVTGLSDQKIQFA
jgi:hypothetical protein